MAALAFLYRGLTRFSLGESILVEGCIYALQSWFIQHVPARANSFRYNGQELFPVAQYRSMIDSIQEDDIV
jgi:predicted RNA polymerase sigma factor